MAAGIARGPEARARLKTLRMGPSRSASRELLLREARLSALLMRNRRDARMFVQQAVQQ